MISLNLGSGAHPDPAYVNLDLVRWDWVVPDVFGDARRMPFKDQAFDQIYSRATLEHIPTWDLKRFLKECRRVLKIGGKFRVITIDLIWIFEAWRVKKTIDEEFAIGYIYGAKKSPDLPYQDHTTGYTPERLVRVLKEAGFTDTMNVLNCEHLLAEVVCKRES